MKKVPCRRCGHGSWKLLATTQTTFDTETGILESDSYLKREFRCMNCGTKATIEQVAVLDVVLKQI